MQVGISISNITFNDGSSISLQPHDILVLTGGNNVGKSVALRNIGNLFSNNQDPLFKVVTKLDAHHFGSNKDAYNLLADYFKTSDEYIFIYNSQVQKQYVLSS